MPKPHHPPGSLCWFECGSTAPAKVKAFYADLFGWKTVDMPMTGGGPGPYTLFQVGDEDTAGLYELAGPQFEGVPSNWATYACVANADESVAQAVDLGAKVILPPMDVPGVARIAFLADPMGAQFGVFQPQEHPGLAQPGSVHGAMGWSELATTDAQAAAAFYCELFGWGTKVDDSGPVTHTEFLLEGQSIGGMMEMTPEEREAPPHWMPYVLVDDCDESAALVLKLDGSLLVPATDIPNVGRFAVFQDPAGACLAMIKLNSHA